MVEWVVGCMAEWVVGCMAEWVDAWLSGWGAISVDMTQEQLAVALQHEEFHRQKFGYPVRNTR